MADHSDDVCYGVQRGDGVYTGRSDVQLVADRGASLCRGSMHHDNNMALRTTPRFTTHTIDGIAYPTPGQPYWNTYGPGLSSASKLYSFGYLETVSLPEFEGGPVPSQGTALFAVGLKEGKEGEAQDIR